MAPAGSWLVNFTETDRRSCSLGLNLNSPAHLGPASGQALSTDPSPSLGLDPRHVLSIERGKLGDQKQVWTLEMWVLLQRGGASYGDIPRLRNARLCHFLAAWFGQWLRPCSIQVESLGRPRSPAGVQPSSANAPSRCSHQPLEFSREQAGPLLGALSLLGGGHCGLPSPASLLFGSNSPLRPLL